MIKEIYLKQINDAHDGTLSIAEAEGQIPFKIKEFFISMILKLQNQKEFHAHKKIKTSNICSIGLFHIDIR